MVKQFSGYRVKGCKEFIFIFGEIRVKLKATELQRKKLSSRFLSQFSAKFINVGRM